MPMVPSALKSKMKATIYDGLKAQFGGATGEGKEYTGVADPMWEKMAEAISGIAADIVMEITTNAMVMPGIAIVGVGGGVPGPVSGATSAPGKIS